MSEPILPTSNQHCTDCGMEVSASEYHPYAACLMYKQCRDGMSVRANLADVWRACREFDKRDSAPETAGESQRKAAKQLVDWLPITTPELIRLRNANAITFGKQANAITTCLIQLRELFAGSPEETSECRRSGLSEDAAGTGPVDNQAEARLSRREVTAQDGWKCIACDHENPPRVLRCQNPKCPVLGYSSENGRKDG